MRFRLAGGTALPRDDMANAEQGRAMVSDHAAGHGIVARVVAPHALQNISAPKTYIFFHHEAHEVWKDDSATPSW